MNLADLGHLHDYWCERIVVEDRGRLILETRSPDIRPHVVLVFQESKHISLRDVFLDNIFSDILEVPPSEIPHNRLCNKYLADIVNPSMPTGELMFRAWTITSSYGMEGAVLAKALDIRLRTTGKPNGETK